MWNRIEYKRDEMVGEAYYLHDVNNAIKRRQAMFRCKCGNTFIAQIYKVKTCETRSCGCIQAKATSESNSTHGLSKIPLYTIWKAIKSRCYNVKNKAYHNYGGRGVVVCNEWKNDFTAFYLWAMSNGYKKGLQIDKDIKGDGLLYSPQTCIFVTPKVNSNNRRSNVYIDFNNDSKTISQWADKIGIPMKILHQRLSRGWSIEKSLTA